MAVNFKQASRLGNVEKSISSDYWWTCAVHSL